MRHRLSGSCAGALAFALVFPACVSDADPPIDPPADPLADPHPAPVTDKGAAPLAGPTCADHNPLKNAYFGDLHTHTTFSYDAYTFETRTTPLDAYAFAKGMAITIAGAHPGGPTTKLDRPLDFAAITDHSELLAIDLGC